LGNRQTAKKEVQSLTAKQDALLEVIRKTFPNARREKEGGWRCVVVDETPDGSVKDLAWFMSVFSAAGIDTPGETLTPS
jgi:hypothetical protein